MNPASTAAFDCIGGPSWAIDDHFALSRTNPGKGAGRVLTKVAKAARSETGRRIVNHQSDRKKSRTDCLSFFDSALKLLITWLASEG
jgi:hypothetical protein